MKNFSWQNSIDVDEKDVMIVFLDYLTHKDATLYFDGTYKNVCNDEYEWFAREYLDYTFGECTVMGIPHDMYLTIVNYVMNIIKEIQIKN